MTSLEAVSCCRGPKSSHTAEVVCGGKQRTRLILSKLHCFKTPFGRLYDPCDISSDEDREIWSVNNRIKVCSRGATSRSVCNRELGPG